MSSIDGFAHRGFRSLGVARKDAQNRWQFLGVLPLFDPPRNEAKAIIATARRMGVKVKMVTGDQLPIAQETAQKLGMGTNILDASGFENTNSHQEELLAESIENADGFAQVFPEHKFHIVEVLQQRGHIVGMTGDGVNDAPALKKADCGIAVSGATDAARAAASIVLMAPGLSMIVDAIKSSRKIFQRMNSYAIYRITETLRVLLFMTSSILAFNFYPLTAPFYPLPMTMSIAITNQSDGTCPLFWGSPPCSVLAEWLQLLACSISGKGCFPCEGGCIRDQQGGWVGADCARFPGCAAAAAGPAPPAGGCSAAARGRAG